MSPWLPSDTPALFVRNPDTFELCCNEDRSILVQVFGHFDDRTGSGTTISKSNTGNSMRFSLEVRH